VVYIVGIGPGSRQYILPVAEKTIKDCDIVIGFKRAIKSIDYIDKEKFISKSLKEITDFINKNLDKIITIVASGDPGFYGITDYIKNNYSGRLQVIPGLSSFQYMMAKLNISWQGAHLGSLHGRDQQYIKEISKHTVSIWLTDKVNSPQNISLQIYKADIAAQVYVGENLSYLDEKIVAGTSYEISKMDFSDLCVMVVINPNALDN
jgi:cobalt-precorrin-7 (C5)-methyltransferase